VSLAQSLDRWGAVLRYHRPQQLARRLWNRVREKLPLSDTAIDGPTPNLRTSFSRDPKGSASLRVAAKHDSSNSKTELLNHDFELGFRLRWDDADREGMPLLAVFHLQYHEWLLERGDEAFKAIESWITRFPLPDRTPAGWAAWHPYCISRRMFVWIHLLECNPPSELRTLMIDHLAKQARRLTSKFELDIGGNHLWENARALAAAGAVFEGEEADRWREQGLTTLWHCIGEQLSPEGEHYERSPMYQEDLASGLLDLAGILEAVDRPAAERCQATALRMTNFLDAIRHPDGGIPLFGDSTLDHGARSASKGETTYSPLLAQRAPVTAWHGDYFIHRDERSFLLFDAGDIGPDDLPAHAHADLLGFEASAFGQRLFVDSGVFCYQGARREEFRQSAAHNMMTIDGVELADVWGSFRVGRRGHVVDRQSGTQDGVQWVVAEHDAYRRMGIRVQRWWLFDEGVWISVHAAIGAGERTLTERLHLHPEVDWTRNADSVRLNLNGGSMHWVPLAGNVRTESTAYSERFYQERPKTTLVMERRANLPAASGWGLSLYGEDIQLSASIDRGRLVVQWTHGNRERRFERNV
jgi:uncharacterized heparinase superfamily protein